MKKKHNAFNKHGPRKSKAQKFRRKKKGDLEKEEITLLEASKAKVRLSSLWGLITSYSLCPSILHLVTLLANLST